MLDEGGSRTAIKHLLVCIVVIAVLGTISATPAVANQGVAKAPPEGQPCGSDHSGIDKSDSGHPGGFDGTFGPPNRIEVPDGRVVKSIDFVFPNNSQSGWGTIRTLISASVGVSDKGLFYKTIEQCWEDDREKSGTIQNFTSRDEFPGDNDTVTIRYSTASSNFTPEYIGWDGFYYSVSSGSSTQTKPTVKINYKNAKTEEIPPNGENAERVQTVPRAMEDAPPYIEPAVIGSDANVSKVMGKGFRPPQGEPAEGDIWWFGVKSVEQKTPQWYQKNFSFNSGKPYDSNRTLLTFDKQDQPLLIGWNMSTRMSPKSVNIQIRYENLSPDQIEYTGPDPHDADGLLLPPNVTYVGTIKGDPGKCNQDRPRVIGGDGKPCRVYQLPNFDMGGRLSGKGGYELTVREYLMMFSRDYDVQGRLDEKQITSQSSVGESYNPKDEADRKNRRATQTVAKATLSTDKRYNKYPFDAIALNDATWRKESNPYLDKNFGTGKDKKLACGRGTHISNTSYMSGCNMIHNILQSAKVHINGSYSPNFVPAKGWMAAATSISTNLDPDDQINDSVEGDGKRKVISNLKDRGPLRTCLVRNVPPSKVRGRSETNPCTAISKDYMVRKLTKPNRFSPQFKYTIQREKTTENISLVSHQGGKYKVKTQKWDAEDMKWETTNTKWVKTGIMVASHVPDVIVGSTNVTGKSANIRSEKQTNKTIAKEFYLNISTEGTQANIWGAVSINGTNSVLSQWDFMTYRDPTWDYFRKTKISEDLPDGPGDDRQTALERLRMNPAGAVCNGLYSIPATKMTSDTLSTNVENLSVALDFNSSVNGTISVSIKHREQYNNSTQVVWTNKSRSLSNADNIDSWTAEYPPKAIIVEWGAGNASSGTPYAPERITIRGDDQHNIWVAPVTKCRGGAQVQEVVTKRTPVDPTPMDVIAVPTGSPEAVGQGSEYTTIEERIFVKDDDGDPKWFVSPFSSAVYSDPLPENVITDIDLGGIYRQTSALVVHHTAEGVYELPSGDSEYPEGDDLTSGTVASNVYNVSEVGPGDVTATRYNNNSMQVDMRQEETTVQPVEITHDYDSNNDTMTITVRRMNGSPISREKARGTLIYNGTRYKLSADGTVDINMSEPGAGKVKFIPEDWWTLDVGKIGYVRERNNAGVGAFESVDDWIDYILLNFGAPAFLVLSFYWLVRRDYFLSRLGFAD